MRWYLAGLVAVAAVSCSTWASAGDSVEKPRLDLRASPRVGFSPVEIFAIGELKGGHDSEEFYCPGLVWDWGDGTRSSHESDCSPYEDGARLDRFFTARHAFRTPGTYAVRLVLVRAGRTITTATASIMIYGHLGGGSGPGY